MMDYQIAPNSRKCTVTGRDLNQGDRFFSALVEESGRLVRKDYSAEAWTGPPTGALGFWCGKVPPPDDPGKPRIDEDLLEECFHRLEGQTDPSRLNFRYVVTLLLVRRKRFRMELADSPPGQLCVRCLRTEQKHMIDDPKLSEEEIAQVQEEVFRVLGWS